MDRKPEEQALETRLFYFVTLKLFFSLRSFSGAFVRVVCGCQGDHKPLGGQDCSATCLCVGTIERSPDQPRRGWDALVAALETRCLPPAQSDSVVPGLPYGGD